MAQINLITSLIGKEDIAFGDGFVEDQPDDRELTKLNASHIPLSEEGAQALNLSGVPTVEVALKAIASKSGSSGSSSGSGVSLSQVQTLVATKADKSVVEAHIANTSIHGGGSSGGLTTTQVNSLIEAKVAPVATDLVDHKATVHLTTSGVNSLIDAKVNPVVSSVASKADASALASKANVSDLASKADASALANKADVSALAGKMNTSDLSTAIADYLAANPPSVVGMVPVGAIIAWHKNLLATALTLPSQFVECNGQKLNDVQSPFNGQWMPDLNNQRRFLRGDTISGTPEDASVGSHTHTATIAAHQHNLYYATDASGNVIPDGESKIVGTTNTANMVLTSPAVPTPALAGRTASATATSNRNIVTDSATPAISVAINSVDENRPKNMGVVWIMRVK